MKLATSLKNASLGDSNNYTLTATNGGGQKTSSQIDIEVLTGVVLNSYS